jgi:hypothetical protein
MKGHLKAGAEMRTFEGNYSSPPTQFAIVDMDIDVFGSTDEGSLIEFGGQLGFGRTVNIHGDHRGLFRLMYFYGSYGVPADNATVHVFGHCYGTIESSNMTADAHNSGFRDNGSIIVEGDVKSGAQINHTGHVGPQHLTDVIGNFEGRYYAGGGIQKKYAGILHVHGSSTGTIEITPSMDSMNFNSFSEMKGGAITIDGDMTSGYIKLRGSNDPPCAWTCNGPDDPSPYDYDACLGTWPCSPPSGCAGLFPQECMDVESCATVCGCLDSSGNPPSGACDQQSAATRENFIQHPGALVDGTVSIAGRLAAHLILYGDIGAHGTIRVGTLAGGDGSVVLHAGDLPAGIQQGGRLLVDGPFTGGSISVSGDVAGQLSVSEFKPTTSGSITIDKSLTSTGLLEVRGEMQNASIVLNQVSGTTAGTINIGTSSTRWTTVNELIDFGDIVMNGDHTGTIKFSGCFGEPTDSFESLCRNGANNPGQVLTNFCPGATATVICNP